MRASSWTTLLSTALCKVSVCANQHIATPRIMEASSKITSPFGPSAVACQRGATLDRSMCSDELVHGSHGRLGHVCMCAETDPDDIAPPPPPPGAPPSISLATQMRALAEAAEAQAEAATALGEGWDEIDHMVSHYPHRRVPASRECTLTSDTLWSLTRAQLIGNQTRGRAWYPRGGVGGFSRQQLGRRPHLTPSMNDRRAPEARGPRAEGRGDDTRQRAHASAVAAARHVHGM